MAGSFSTAVPAAVSRVPGVTAISTVYGDQFEVRQSIESIKGLDQNLSETLILRMASGSAAALRPAKS